MSVAPSPLEMSLLYRVSKLYGCDMVILLGFKEGWGHFTYIMIVEILVQDRKYYAYFNR